METARAILALLALAVSGGVQAVDAAGVGVDDVVHALDARPFASMEEGIARFTEPPALVLLGTVGRFAVGVALGWAGAVFALAALLLRRLPVWLVLEQAPRVLLRLRREQRLAGRFEPSGNGALFPAHLLPSHHRDDTVRAATALVVTLTRLHHGVTATPRTRLSGDRRTEAHGRTAS